MRYYHFTKGVHGIENIQRRRLKVATINQLNDPFELLGVASKDAIIRKRYRELKAGLADYLGFLCFSTNWSNPVQWSHYADHHRGICLGFDISDSAELQEVRYARHRLKPDTKAMETDGPDARAHIVKILSTKFSHWHYEKEHRLFVHLNEKDGDLYFYDFGDVLQLREVIVGAESDISRSQVLNAVGDLRGVELLKARLAFRSFKVVKQKAKNLWK